MGDRTRLDFSAGIGIDLGFVGGSKVLGFVSASKLTCFFRRGIKIDLELECLSKLTRFQWWVEINLFFVWGIEFLYFLCGWLKLA